MRAIKNKYFYLAIIIAISVFFHFYKYSEVPACVNADEAAFGYNAFSITKTLKDEYGAFLPSRLQSFNDIKLPLYTYLTAPFVAVLGLNMFSVRLAARLAGIVLVPIVFLFAYELFRDKKVADLAALLTALSPWVYIVSRHAHEASISAPIIAVSIWMLVRYINTDKRKYALISLGAIFLATFSYHSARLFLFFNVGVLSIALLKKRKLTASFIQTNMVILIILVAVITIPLGIDMRHGASRVRNLFFTTNTGFQASLDEYLREDSNRIFHNKGTQFFKEAVFRYVQQTSPEFFILHGDTNPRFGMNWLSLITPIEYMGIGMGLYYLFKNKARHRWMLVAMLLLAPLGNSLTWIEYSLTRIYVMIIPILIIVAYGGVCFFKNISNVPPLQKRLIIGFLVGGFLFFNLHSHDVYFNHYFKRALVQRSWQCGYEDLGQYIQDSYSKTKTYYITRKYGQPYIFLLFFMQYDPARYQHSAKLSKPDEYGFTQVESFDKFVFSIPGHAEKNSTVIGFPDDFIGSSYDPKKIRKIIYGTEEIFWIYEN